MSLTDVTDPRFTAAQLATLAAFESAPAPPEVREAALRAAVLKHHPIAHTMTGPLKGCRCGQVRLGQDVIAHVSAELRAALAPQAGDGAR